MNKKNLNGQKLQKESRKDTESSSKRRREQRKATQAEGRRRLSTVFLPPTSLTFTHDSLFNRLLG
jgi:hypothetical protein